MVTTEQRGIAGKEYLEGHDGGTVAFDDLRTEFNNRYAEVARDRNSWRMATFAAMAFLLLTPLGWVYVMTLPKQRIEVIEISSWGEAKYRGEVGQSDAEGNIVRPSQSILFHLTRFITGTRSYSSDVHQEEKILNEVFSSCTDKMAAVLNSKWKKISPYKLGQDSYVDLKIETVFPVGAMTYQIEWTEREFGRDNVVNRFERFRGAITLYYDNPKPEHKEYNPLGIYVNQFDFSKVGDVKDAY